MPVRLLHIIASPRGARSASGQVAEAFLSALQTNRPDVEVDVLDLFDHDLPAVAGDNIEVKYALMAGRPADRDHQDSWRRIERLIAHFLAADVYVVSTPMWNLGIPYTLKYYLDCLIQPGYLFRYDDAGGVEPLVRGKRMVCVASRGSDYSPGSPLHTYDFQQPYLRAIFGFVGLTDVEFIDVQPTDVSPELRQSAIRAAAARAQDLAASPAWAQSVPATSGV
jgi:FMN-dependent NADH-azoreductase